jgi:hypothetical protein
MSGDTSLVLLQQYWRKVNAMGIAYLVVQGESRESFTQQEHDDCESSNCDWEVGAQILHFLHQKSEKYRQMNSAIFHAYNVDAGLARTMFVLAICTHRGQIDFKAESNINNLHCHYN